MTIPLEPPDQPVAPWRSLPRWLAESRTRGVAGIVAFVAIALGSVTYAKWWPYAGKVSKVVASGRYKGKSLFAAAGAAPSWHATWHFVTGYGEAVWIALIAGLLIGAGVEVLIPRLSLSRLLGSRRGWSSSVRGGLFGLPCLMCTCCSSPITVSLRRAGVPVSGALSYWLSNPLLNPAVLVILAVVLPWPFVVVRIVIGAFLVFAAAPIVSRLAPANRHVGAVTTASPVASDGQGVARASVAHDTSRVEAAQVGESPVPTFRGYLKALGRLSAVIVPEYAIVIVVIGVFSGWLLPFTHVSSTWVPGATVVAAVAGTLLVVPTAGEIAVILGLVALGAPLAVMGALVIALPAVSLPSMTMVGRSISWRVTAAIALCVAAAAVAAGIFVTVL